jgi:hypothetical protein
MLGVNERTNEKNTENKNVFLESGGKMQILDCK